MNYQDDKKHYVAPAMSVYKIEPAQLMAASGEENGKAKTETLNKEDYEWE